MAIIEDAAWPHVSQTVVCDTWARAPSGVRRGVSYPVSDSMFCIRRANEHGTENHSDKSAAVGPSSNPHGFMPRRPAPRRPAIAHARVRAAELAAWRAKTAAAPEPGAQGRGKTSVGKMFDKYRYREGFSSAGRRARPSLSTGDTLLRIALPAAGSCADLRHSARTLKRRRRRRRGAVLLGTSTLF